MGTLLAGLTLVVQALFSPLEGLHPLLSLLPLSALAGLFMAWTVHRTVDHAAASQLKRRLIAHLYEFRLFAEEPRLIWRAQKGLLAASAGYAATMVRPGLILAVPFILLLPQLDAFYGRRPLPVGQPALLVLQSKGPLNRADPDPVLESPAGLMVESPPLRLLARSQIVWRIRPAQELSGVLRIVFPTAAFQKTIQAGPGPRYVSSKRVSSTLGLLQYPGEKSFDSNLLDWIEIRYPPAYIELGPFSAHWQVWFWLIAIAVYLVSRRKVIADS